MQPRREKGYEGFLYGVGAKRSANLRYGGVPPSIFPRIYAVYTVSLHFVPFIPLICQRFILATMGRLIRCSLNLIRLALDLPALV